MPLTLQQMLWAIKAAIPTPDLAPILVGGRGNQPITDQVLRSIHEDRLGR